MRTDIARKNSRRGKNLKQMPEEENNSALSKKDVYGIMLQGYPDVMDIEQVCQVLGVSTKTGYKLINEGKLRCLKVGRSYRIPKLLLLVYLGVCSENLGE